jgi:hypothetical protein
MTGCRMRATNPLTSTLREASMRTGLIASLSATLIGIMTLPAPGAAQIRASELGTVSQTIDGTTIAIEYSRPRARGRDSLFGGVVHWGEHWTPGANWATTFDVNHDIEVNGKPVPVGSTRASRGIISKSTASRRVRMDRRPDRASS